MIRLTCAQTAGCRRGATFRSGCVVRCCARLHCCASVSASPSQRREWLTARRLPGCILESAASVSCSLAPMRQVSLPPRLPPPTLLGLGAERDARRAHVVGGERIHTHRKEEKERGLSRLSSPLTLTHHHAPDQAPHSAIQAEQTPFPHYYSFLSSSNCIWDVHAAGNVDCSYTFWGGLLYCNTTVRLSL